MSEVDYTAGLVEDAAQAIKRLCIIMDHVSDAEMVGWLSEAADTIKDLLVGFITERDLNRS